MHHPARRRVYRILERLELNASLSQLIEQTDQMAQGAAEPVDLPDHENVALFQGVQGLCEFRPDLARSRDADVHEDRVASLSLQREPAVRDPAPRSKRVRILFSSALSDQNPCLESTLTKTTGFITLSQAVGAERLMRCWKSSFPIAVPDGKRDADKGRFPQAEKRPVKASVSGITLLP